MLLPPHDHLDVTMDMHEAEFDHSNGMAEGFLQQFVVAGILVAIVLGLVLWLSIAGGGSSTDDGDIIVPTTLVDRG